MHDIVHTSIDFIRQHGAWAGPVMFVVSFGESFVGLSLLFPGTTIMVLAGTLVRWPYNPHGVLEIWPLLLGGILGAVSGDAISFGFGRRFGHVLDKHWYFVRHPQLLTRGYRFFDKYGTASVFIGRFFGPVRAAIPLVAGIMNMSWRQFWIANVGSALIWAPALLLLGTSFHLIIHALGIGRGEALTVTITAVIIFMLLVAAAHRIGLLDQIRATWRKRAGDRAVEK